MPLGVNPKEAGLRIMCGTLGDVYVESCSDGGGGNGKTAEAGGWVGGWWVVVVVVVVVVGWL